MSQVKQPSKEQIRAYMAQRQRAHQAPAEPRNIRRQLGWQLIFSESACVR